MAEKSIILNLNPDVLYLNFSGCFHTLQLIWLRRIFLLSVRVTSCLQLQEVTKKSRPDKPSSRKNSTQLVVGVEAGPPPLHLKRRP